MSYPQNRNRRLRQNPVIRSLVAENSLKSTDFLVPLFVMEGENRKQEISSMPGYYRFTADQLLDEVADLVALGLRSFLLFVMVPEDKKDNDGREALNPDGLMPRTITLLKKNFPDILIMTDVAMDPYSSYGHDGIVRDNKILNDETNEILAGMSLMHARAGADFVAPSDMMDGRIRVIRQALEAEGMDNIGIMAYSAKYASCFYGPFRDALDSAPGFGDKKTYQMDPSNQREAIREAQMDVEEGADLVMVKPALSYLDVIKTVKDVVTVPVAAYQVSGEYAMVKAAAEKGWIDGTQAMLEILLSIKRAGADLIATYFAKEAVLELKKHQQ